MADRERPFELNWISKYRDELLGIAILSIMVFHFTECNMRFGGHPTGAALVFIRYYYRYIGSVGVELFVFLSGMGLYYSFSKNNDLRRFYKRRFQRILIPYIITGGLYWLFMDIIISHNGFLRWLEDVTFISFLLEGVNNFWFIIFIAFMYLLFPLLYRAICTGRGQAAWFILILAVSVAIPILVYEYAHEVYKHLNIAITRAPIFIIGMSAGEFIRRGVRFSGAAAAAMIFAGFLIRYWAVVSDAGGYLGRYSASVFSLAVLLLCAWLLHLIRRAKPVRIVLRFFGRHSLELYLLHVAMWGVFGALGVVMYRASRFFTMLGLAVILAPLLKWLTGRLSFRGQAPDSKTDQDR